MNAPTVRPLAHAHLSMAPTPASPFALRGWRLPVAGLALVALGAAAGHWALPQQRDTGAPAPTVAMARAAQADAPSTPAQAATPQGTAAPAVAPSTAPRSSSRSSAHAAAKPHPVQAHAEPAVGARSPAPVATGSADAQTARPLPTQPVAATAPRCADCGVVERVTPFQRPGQASGVGAVAGTVLGGVLGHQVGGGTGRKLMTVIGAVGGGLAGHEIEKRQRASTEYRVTLRMADGSTRSVTQATAPSVGQWVRVQDGQLRPLQGDGAVRAADPVDAVPVQAPATREPGWQSS